jgi:hypothetical protein
MLCLTWTLQSLTPLTRTVVPSRFSRRVHENFQLLAELSAGNGVGEIALNVQAIFELTHAHIPSRLREFECAFNGGRVRLHRHGQHENAAEPVTGSAAKVQRDVRPTAGGRIIGQTRAGALAPNRYRFLSALCDFRVSNLNASDGLSRPWRSCTPLAWARGCRSSRSSSCRSRSLSACAEALDKSSAADDRLMEFSTKRAAVGGISPDSP